MFSIIIPTLTSHFTSLLQMQDIVKLPSTSKQSYHHHHATFSVYAKGLVIDETVTNVKMSFGGIGVAIFDNDNDRCVRELSKSFLLDAVGTRATDCDVVDLNALIEAMNAAVNLRIKRVHVFCDNVSVHGYLTGEEKPTNRKIMKLVDQFNLIKDKIDYFKPHLVTQNDIKLVYKLAKDSVSSESTKWAESTSSVTLVEQCTICCEFINSDKMFCVNKCQHRYCYSCMRKHVEAKLLQGQLPECPHEKCGSQFKVESCKVFLKPELYDIMSSRIKEASIPPSEKVYCPFPNCSALMSKTEVEEYYKCSGLKSGKRKCVKCNRFFCISCKVPWHDDIICSEYKNSFLFKSSNEGKLLSLATKNRWRQCIKCSNLVELKARCFHIHCRCGYEFCYICGAEYRNKKASCTCPLWEERYIMYA
ncbi:E3 ubiquitin-protein ligase RSL1-like [Rutidosis leptorrhynchoides]|uniref:E3 ubiquitin-protein ligase RSL1-like n=1 Tax=Rutidosis leptorrhynchoides TaxID=125765 RepID=UPI003A998045